MDHKKCKKVYENSSSISPNESNCERKWTLSGGNILVAGYKNGRPVATIGKPSEFRKFITVECTTLIEFLVEEWDEIKDCFQKNVCYRDQFDIDECFEDDYYSELKFSLHTNLDGVYGLRIHLSNWDACFDFSHHSSDIFLEVESLKKIHRYRHSILKHLYFLGRNLNAIKLRRSGLMRPI